MKLSTNIIEVVLAKHQGEKILKLIFSYNKDLIQQIRNIPGCRWSESMHCWHVPYCTNLIARLNALGIAPKFNETDFIVLKQDYKNSLNDFYRYLKWKRFSPKTISSYLNAVKKFLLYYHNEELEQLSNQEINAYLYYLQRNGFSTSTQNIFVSGIKLFFRKIADKNVDVLKVERPIRSKPLPKVIAKEDIESMMATISNIKHKTALLLIYALGLRRSELINMKLADIDSKRMMLSIRNAKGQKDRTLPISPKLMEHIKKYYFACRPIKYLIEGAKKGESYSPTSLQKIFHFNMDRIKPNNTFTLHCLRHSCATHLLENGTDIRFIQELLGHKSTRTTEIYTHVSMRSLKNIKNPSDDFDI